jgi:hypothetical protein
MVLVLFSHFNKLVQLERGMTNLYCTYVKKVAIAKGYKIYAY